MGFGVRAGGYSGEGITIGGVKILHNHACETDKDSCLRQYLDSLSKAIVGIENDSIEGKG